MTPPHPRFVVTGCARSGTLFMAEALSRLGHPCGHEVLFTPDTTTLPDFGNGRRRRVVVGGTFRRPTTRRQRGAAPGARARWPRSARSWGCACSRPGPTCGMQLRYRLQHLHDPRGPADRQPTLRAVRRRSLPRGVHPDDEPSRAATYWIRWNQLIQDRAKPPATISPYRRYRVEDLDDELLVELDGLLGGHATRGRGRRGPRPPSAPARTAPARSTRCALDDLATPAARRPAARPRPPTSATTSPAR